jgi:hypothetical protein
MRHGKLRDVSVEVLAFKEHRRQLWHLVGVATSTTSSFPTTIPFRGLAWNNITRSVIRRITRSIYLPLSIPLQTIQPKRFVIRLLHSPWRCVLTFSFQDFIPKLKTHLLGRLLGEAFDGDEPRFSGEARNSVRIIGNKIYSAKVLRINYTTYDMRRDQDSMNPRTSCDVMVISPEKQCGAHPYWYARVLGVFHAQVLHTGPEARNRSVQHMEFLWVHWFGVEPNYQTGSRMARLPKIGFVPDTDESAFGFLDPSLVLRGCHLVPAFAHGRTQDLLRMTSLTAARQPEETDEWVNYYVIMCALILFNLTYFANAMRRSWVDWDMFMRYLGGGIGHLSQPQRSPDVDSKDGQVGMDVDHDSSAAAEENPIIETPLQDLQKLGVNSAGAGSSCGSSRSSDDGSSEADGSDIDSCLDSDPSATTEWDSEDKEDEDGSDLGFEDDESDGDGAEDTSW